VYHSGAAASGEIPGENFEIPAVS